MNNIQTKNLEILNKTLKDIKINSSKDEVIFETIDKKYLMYHDQDCCEQVQLQNICGDLDDLIGSELLVAEVVTKTNETTTDVYGLWTFYKFSTTKGSVTFRWYGVTSSCYSVAVDFKEILLK